MFRKRDLPLPSEDEEEVVFKKPAAILQKTVVERTPAAPTTWDESLLNAVQQSYKTTQAALRYNGAIEVEESVMSTILNTSSAAAAGSAYRRARLIEKMRLDQAFRLPTTHVNPVNDDMVTMAEQSTNATIKGVRFELMPEDELYNVHGNCLSEVRVFQEHGWDTRLDGPASNSVLDERMGPVRSKNSDGTVAHCLVCSGYKNVDHYTSEKRGEPNLCPGHFGHIMLPAALWHPMMVQTVQRMLRAFCWHCGELPSSDERNRAVVAEMFQTCETRVDKINFLAQKYADVKTCEQCAKHRRCHRCHEDDIRCEECVSFQYFRPRIRTTMQAEKAKDNLRKHMIDAENLGDDADDVRRAVRSNNFTGFPCDILLDGHVSADDGAQMEAYARFAYEQYGDQADNGVMVMHGERVRAVIEQMSSKFLQLFCASSFETVESVRTWFRTMVPRVIPVIPNPARPTAVGHAGSDSVRYDDLSVRYRELVRRCTMFSRRLDHHHPSGNPTTVYGDQADIYESKRDSWFEWTPLDFNLMELYGELQYYYAAIISDQRALQFRPSLAAAHGIGNSVLARKSKTSTAGGSDDSRGANSTLVSSIERRLNGKEGRLRGYLQGKRVDNGARTVITCAPIYSIRDVCVPARAASLLYVKERVHALNVTDMIARAERARTGDVEHKKNHKSCGGRGCAHCEQLWVTEKTELCMFSPENDERIRFTGAHPLQTPIGEHPLVRQVGAVIERTLKTGDYVVMNRQPSLHKHSIMSHRVIVDPHSSTLQLHELATDPYNADFDGDEMHCFVTGDLQAQAESRTIMAVPAQMVSTRDSSTIFGLKQNAATGIYLLTAHNTFLSHDEACTLLMAVEHPIFPTLEGSPQLPQPAIRVKRPGAKRWQSVWTGLQIANFTLPQSAPSLYMKRPATFELNADIWAKDNAVPPMLIEKSELLMGRIDSKAAHAIINAIASRTSLPSERARNEACDFIDRCAWLASAFLTLRGFSIGLGDCVLPNEQVARQVNEVIEKTESEIEDMLQNDDELLRRGNHTNRVSAIEERIMEIEKKATAATWRIIAKALSSSNALSVMEKSGGKGKPENANQIMGCIGGQLVEGRRPIDTYAGLKSFRTDGSVTDNSGNSATSETTSGGSSTHSGKASLTRKGKPSVTAMDPDIPSRMLDFLGRNQLYHTRAGIRYPGLSDGGFIKNSYMTGLTPREFFAHAQAGREGLIDTAVKTGDIGDESRLSMKSSEDVVLRADNTVRNATNQLVAFRYGGNGYDPTFAQYKALPFIGMNNEALQRALFYDERRDIVAGDVVLQHEARLLRSILIELRTLSSICNSGCDIHTPNNLNAIITEVLGELGEDRTGAQWRSLDDKRVQWLWRARQDGGVSERECVQIVDEWCVKWRRLALCDYVTECEVRLRLSSKQVVRRLRLSVEALLRVLELYEEVLYRARAPPGESVGAQMVQSIGQPATQMTLNSFHFTGKKSMALLGGVPRMKELSKAARSARMKTVKVVLPLARGLLMSTGQRKLAAGIASKLVMPDALRVYDTRTSTLRDGKDPGYGFHEKRVIAAMQAPMRQMAAKRFEHHRRVVEKALALQSAGRASPVDHHVAIENLLEDIGRFLPSKDDELSDDVDDALAPVRTLDAMTRRWRIVGAATLQQHSGWSAESLRFAERAHTVMLAEVRCPFDTSVELFCESVWRAVLPVFGADVPCVVLPRVISRDMEDSVGGAAKRRRRTSDRAEGVAEMAIMALDCKTDSYEKKMYEYLRLNRRGIFVDLLEENDADEVVHLWRAALYSAQHQEPPLFTAAVANVNPEAREDELMRRKLQDISVAQMRSHFKNIVSTRLKDIVLAHMICFEPIIVDADTGRVTVRHTTSGKAAASEDDVTDYGTYFSRGCFDVFDIGCREPSCLAARDDPNSSRRASALSGCLGSWVLVFRLSSQWFLRNSVAPQMIADALQGELGAFFHVTVGDANCQPHIPLRIRCYTCRLDDALSMTNKATLTKLDVCTVEQAGKEVVILERIKWEALFLSILGPLYGSVVMCEDEYTQLFTDEGGLERTQRPLIASNSSDLYHLLSLRGIDTRTVRSNSVHDTLDVLGVEAARMTLIQQYSVVLAGTTINRAHFSLRADIQTRDGGFVSLTAAGLRSAPHDACQSASHRETATTFVQSALKQATSAPLVSPSASVMMGQPLAYNGTGSVMLLADLDALQTMPCFEQPEPAAILAAQQSAQDAEMVEHWRAIKELSEELWDTTGGNAEPVDANACFSPVRPDTPEPDYDIDISRLPEPIVADEVPSSESEDAYDPAFDVLEPMFNLASTDSPVFSDDDTPSPKPSQMSARIASAKRVSAVTAALGGSIAYSPTEIVEYDPTQPEYDPFGMSTRVNLRMF